ncbi:glutamine-rich protein 2 isoform X2 [Heliangelus exortis]|uniref:glutamine-rich protein 2 isoform X2 n=1 Tax=Heliangelus exortis TaxID=472823 RepID=UPI003A8F8243
MASLSLAQMLDLAIGSPEIWVLNLQALHRLLQAMLGHLGIKDLPAQEPQCSPTTRGTSVATDPGQGKEMEGKQNSVSQVGLMPIGPFPQDKAVSQDLLQELREVKAEQARMAEEMQRILEALGLEKVEGTAGQLQDQETLESEEATTWEEGQLLGEEGSGGQSDPSEPTTSDVDTQNEVTLETSTLETQPVSPGTQTTTMGTQPVSPGTQTTTLETQPVSPSTQTTIPEMQPGTPDTLGTKSGSPGTQTTIPRVQPETPNSQSTIPGTQPGSSGAQTTTLRTQPESPGSQATTPGMQPGTSSTMSTILGMQPTPPGTQGEGAGVQPSPFYMEPNLPGTENVPTEAIPGALGMQVALDQIGQLSHLLADLKEQVVQLENTKADQADLEKIPLLFLKEDQESILSVLSNLQDQISSLQHQVSSVQGLACDLQAQKEKIKHLEEALGKLEVVGAEWRGTGSNQVTQQLGSRLQEIKQELGEEQDLPKPMLGMNTKRAEQLQEEPEKLQGMVGSRGQQQAEVLGVCPTCSTDTRGKLRQLQHYQEHEELLELISQQAVVKVVRQLPWRSQDEKMLKNIQASVVQVQRNCEELSVVTGNLVDEHQQRQQDLEALSQSLERLEKVEKENLVLAIEKKADKAALAGTLRRSHFEAQMEQLEQKNREVLSRISGVELGWIQLQQQLRELMESKLDRLELGRLEQQMEKQRERILEELKERELPAEADDAAGIKKQLLAPLHCLSCDRALSLTLPGPHLETISSLSPLSHRSVGCPQTHLKQELIQQHRHRELMAKYRYPRVPRDCGGQHTLTHPLRRPLRLQPLPHSPPWLLQPPSKDELELLSQDGHRDRDRQLPALKEGFLKDEPKLSPGQRDTRTTLAHGHLSQPPGDRSSTSASGWHWGSLAKPPKKEP